MVGVVVVELPGEEERLEAIGGLEEARAEVEEVDSAPAAAAVAQEMQISQDQQEISRTGLIVSMQGVAALGIAFGMLHDELCLHVRSMRIR